MIRDDVKRYVVAAKDLQTLCEGTGKPEPMNQTELIQVMKATIEMQILLMSLLQDEL